MVQNAPRPSVFDKAILPFTALIPLVEGARAPLLAELTGVSEEQARFKPPGGEGEDAWCIHELVRHLTQSEEGLAERIRLLASGSHADGSIPGRLGGREDEPLPDLLASMAAARRLLLETVAALKGGERLDATAPHAFFGDLNCREWFLLPVIHDAAHARQVQQIKSAPGYPAI